jgi:hypothetical protein
MTKLRTRAILSRDRNALMLLPPGKWDVVARPFYHQFDSCATSSGFPHVQSVGEDMEAAFVTKQFLVTHRGYSAARYKNTAKESDK